MTLKILGFSSVHYPHDSTTFQQLTEGNFRLSVLDTHDAAANISVAHIMHSETVSIGAQIYSNRPR